ncbi:MAG TPA: hypothetical protein VF411_14765 [Bacteroidia bacterium]
MKESHLRKVFNKKKQSINRKTGKTIPGFVSLKFEDFKKWFKSTGFGIHCHYCNIIGRRLDIDRLDDNKPYDDLKNIAWCCERCSPDRFIPPGIFIHPKFKHSLKLKNEKT